MIDSSGADGATSRTIARSVGTTPKGSSVGPHDEVDV